ncbi:non-specific lipid-transfer protein 2 [Sesamum indicum]|uniref:Lipid transfer protein n=1 Tax=Sesamum indicum TaxID=4182 RepID=A5JUZ7_SESIN|nr:non-specific lipid-transfer protein 2 [Sesamum indicum]ABQ53930.1 lipid transfer protein [Sesamum indicum]
MKKGAAAVWWVVAIVVVLAVAEVHETGAAPCNPVELSPCLAAISGSQPPSAECCSKLKEQVPCFCDYVKNPVFKPYVDSPNAKKVAATCGVAFPTC